MASTARSQKRRRHDGSGGAWHESVSAQHDDYSTVSSREGKLLKVGNGTRTAIPDRLVQKSAEAWESTIVWPVLDNTEYGLDSDGHLYDDAVEGDIEDEGSDQDVDEQQGNAQKPKKNRSEVARRPNAIWKALHRELYLDEILSWAGRGDFTDAQHCPDCVSKKAAAPGRPEYRCHECFLPDLTCKQCCIKRHRRHPFHRIELWDSERSVFKGISLKDMGLTIQLNHGSLFCVSPVPAHAKMQVLHTNGMHDVSILYCGCDRAISNHVQLLRRGLYPASQINVQTCATFTLLDLLHKLSLTTKASTYDFYRGLEKMTDNTGLSVPPFRYRQLFRMNSQWRHLKMMKWGGRGHSPSGPQGTDAGELAVLCPSCPHPGINLPPDWENAPQKFKYLYMIFLCIDANFRLKNQLVSNFSQDPGLGTGLSYLVPRERYEAYVRSRATDEDVSTCVGLQALAKAHTKYSTGLRYTGVGAVCCGRSEMLFPTSVGNLQKGERYANMDYLVGSVLQFIAVCAVLVSYDVACQWFVNLFARMKTWPSEIQRPAKIREIIPAIPKLHWNMHETKNHYQYSPNCIPGVGNSDFEAIERIWAPHNALASSTKSQGPGTRHDTLDDNFGFWNWLKYHGQGRTLMVKYKRAIAERNKQVEGHRGLTESLSDDLVKKWTDMCVEWEADSVPKKAKDPYYSETDNLSQSQVVLALSLEEEDLLKRGEGSDHVTSAAGFVTLGLELEELQRRVQRLAKKTTDKSSARQAGGLTEQRNILRKRLRKWEELLPTYMPGLPAYLRSNDGQSPTQKTSTHKTSLSARPQPENETIWLPSAIPANARSAVVARRVAGIEERLRMAQMSDALDAIRLVMKVKTRMIHYKRQNISGQRDGTRSRTVIDGVVEKAQAGADKYNAARVATVSLTPPSNRQWEETYRVLHNSDIRGYQDPERLRERQPRRGTLEDELLERQLDEGPPEESELSLHVQERDRRQGTGETHRTLSWIWTSGTMSVEDDGDEIMRIEWAKSRARAARAGEEVYLVKEEMRRVLAFLEWKASWWEGKRDERIRTEVAATLRMRMEQGMDCPTDDSGQDDILQACLKESKISPALQEGLTAYAHSQADLQRSLIASFRQRWKVPLSRDSSTVGHDVFPNPDMMEVDGEGGADDEDDEDVEDGVPDEFDEGDASDDDE